MYESYKQYYEQLQDTGKYRQLPEVSLPTLKSNHSDIDFSTNDYLSLNHHPLLLEAAQKAAQQYGIGATGSRLLSGNNALYETFETQIAKDKNTQSALIFNSGFQANFTALASLLDPLVLKDKPLVFFDKLNHSSLYQAVFLSGAQLIRYNHNDMNQLSKKLELYKECTRPKFIVSETLFGMDGDKAPLEILALLAKHNKAFLYLDEAHATGLTGINGYGLSTLVNLENIEHCVMGTFSKALGGSGAYIACSFIVKNYLINKAPGFIYSTAAPPMVIGSAYQAWKMVSLFVLEREKLEDLSNYLRQQLNQKGFNTGASTTHIVPILIGDEKKVMQLKQALYEQGILVSAIRPPTVPPQSARLRLALKISHTQKDIDRFVTILEQLYDSI